MKFMAFYSKLANLIAAIAPEGSNVKIRDRFHIYQVTKSSKKASNGLRKSPQIPS